jgi:hypothetical protein
MKVLHILVALLAVSVLVNVGFVAIIYPSLQGDISRLVDKTNTLGTENMQLQKQLDQQNITLQVMSPSQFLLNLRDRLSQ